MGIMAKMDKHPGAVTCRKYSGRTYLADCKAIIRDFVRAQCKQTLAKISEGTREKGYVRFDELGIAVWTAWYHEKNVYGPIECMVVELSLKGALRKLHAEIEAIQQRQVESYLPGDD